MNTELVLAVDEFIRALGLHAPLPQLEDEQLQTSEVALSVDVPPGALYDAQPPLYPRAGTYSFPTGQLLLSSAGLAGLLGWPLQRVRSHRDSQQQQQQWRCRCCGLIVSVQIGPFLTTVSVSCWLSCVVVLIDARVQVPSGHDDRRLPRAQRTSQAHECERLRQTNMSDYFAE